MEFSMSFPLLFASVFFLLMLLRLWKSPKGNGKFPLGPKQLPIIGNLHQFTTGLPHHVVTRLSKKFGPVMKLQLGEVVAVVISSPEAAKEVFKTNEINFAQRPIVYAAEIMSFDHSSLVFSPCNDYWRQLKKIFMMELLSTKRVQSFRSIREEEVWDLIELISASQRYSINLSDKISTMTNNVLSRAALGKRWKDQHDLASLLGKINRLAEGFNIVDLYPSLTFLRAMSGVKPALLAVQKKIDKIIEDLIIEHQLRRKENTNRDVNFEENDVIDTLLNYVEANNFGFQLTVNQVKGIIVDIFGAGSETAATTIEWVMSMLLKNPRVMKKAQSEVRQAFNGKSKIEEADIQKLGYLKSIIKETLRMHPPAPLLPREAVEACEIGGYTIPAKAKVLINVYAIGRDPKIWEDPENFRPERFEGSSIDFKGNNFEFLPFGGGRRNCPGISFATSIIELGLAQMLYHFDWKLPNELKIEDLDMTEKFGTTARRKNNLHVIAITQIPFKK